MGPPLFFKILRQLAVSQEEFERVPREAEHESYFNSSKTTRTFCSSLIGVGAA